MTENTKAISALSTAKPVPHKPTGLGNKETKEETNRGAHTTGPRITGPPEKEKTHQFDVDNKYRRLLVIDSEKGQKGNSHYLSIRYISE